MAIQRVDIQHEFAYPVEQVFAHLSEHENLVEIFPLVSIIRLSDGQSERNGVGSQREIRMLGGPPFVEKITAFEPNKLIEYRITRGSPIKNHRGVMRFSPSPRGCQLHYTIEFEGRLPLIGPIVRMLLDRNIRKGLAEMRL